MVIEKERVRGWVLGLWSELALDLAKDLELRSA
jgi:hypothetical protein